MNSVKVRLVCPSEGEGATFDTTMKSGGGFRWVMVDYSVNPVGSGSLYRVESMTRVTDGIIAGSIPVEDILRLNAPKIIDEIIAMKLHGKYAAEVQKQPIIKRARKKPEPPKEEGQFEIPL